MSRPRTSGRKNWPEHLIARKRAFGPYYVWRDPRSGKEWALGYDKADAMAQAREANMSLQAKVPTATLIDRMAGKDAETLNAWLDIFVDKMKSRQSRKKTGGTLSESTIRNYEKRVSVMRGHFGSSLIAKITTKDCHGLLNNYLSSGKKKYAFDFKTFMVDVFNEAEAAGWIPRGTNPASIIKVAKPKTERSRLSLDNFKTVLEASEGWSRTAILLALVTGQRVSDIAAMRYDQVKGGYLHVQQIKTGQRIKIPVTLSLLGYSLQSIIKDSRKIVGAKTIVHQSESTGRSNPGEALREMTISRQFTKLMRENVKQKFEGTAPTFHEIRSLSKALHAENGIDTLALLGHESESTGKIYSDPRGGWVEIKLPSTALISG